MEQKSGKVSVTTENIFPVIRQWLYSDQDIFVRELVSNCADAVAKLKRLVELGNAKVQDGEDYKINVIYDDDAKTLVFEDNGIGMNAEELARLRGLIDGSVKDDEQHGFGMANVEQRLQMHYGRAYGMKVDSAYGEGTTVTVRIPKVGD